MNGQKLPVRSGSRPTKPAGLYKFTRSDRSGTKKRDICYPFFPSRFSFLAARFSFRLNLATFFSFSLGGDFSFDMVFGIGSNKCKKKIDSCKDLSILVKGIRYKGQYFGEGSPPVSPGMPAIADPEFVGDIPFSHGDVHQ